MVGQRMDWVMSDLGRTLARARRGLRRALRMVRGMSGPAHPLRMDAPRIARSSNPFPYSPSVQFATVDCNNPMVKAGLFVSPIGRGKTSSLGRSFSRSVYGTRLARVAGVLVAGAPVEVAEAVPVAAAAVVPVLS